MAVVALPPESEKRAWQETGAVRWRPILQPITGDGQRAFWNALKNSAELLSSFNLVHMLLGRFAGEKTIAKAVARARRCSQGERLP